MFRAFLRTPGQREWSGYTLSTTNSSKDPTWECSNGKWTRRSVCKGNSNILFKYYKKTIYSL